MKISFVIPTLNEENNIESVLNSIKESVICNKFNYEIIVVDNGSTDKTVEIAKHHGAKVFLRPGISISALRNYGARKSTGSLLVFLDGDICLTPSWGLNIGYTIKILNKNPQIITGSLCGIKVDASWIEQRWFKPRLKKQSVNYINSGHMIILKKYFYILGGFNEKIETGEDYELCKRASKQGARIINNQELSVVHLRYPKTIKDFFKREQWHGKGDLSPLSKIFASKVPLLSFVVSGCLVVSIIATIWTKNLNFLVFYLLLAGAICSAASIHRCKDFGIDMLACTFLFWVYFIARSFSFINILLEKIRGETRRQRW